MDSLKLKISESAAKRISELAPSAGDMTSDIVQMLEYPPDRNMGDLALPCFRFSKILRKAPAMRKVRTKH